MQNQRRSDAEMWWLAGIEARIAAALSPQELAELADEIARGWPAKYSESLERECARVIMDLANRSFDLRRHSKTPRES